MSKNNKTSKRCHQNINRFSSKQSHFHYFKLKNENPSGHLSKKFETMDFRSHPLYCNPAVLFKRTSVTQAFQSNKNRNLGFSSLNLITYISPKVTKYIMDINKTFFKNTFNICNILSYLKNCLR